MAATRKYAPRKKTTTTIEPNLRHVWLASLGLLVAARRESKAAAQRATAKAESAIADARKAVKRAEADLRGGIEGVRDQVQLPVKRKCRDLPLSESYGFGTPASARLRDGALYQDLVTLGVIKEWHPQRHQQQPTQRCATGWQHQTFPDSRAVPAHPPFHQPPPSERGQHGHSQRGHRKIGRKTRR